MKKSATLILVLIIASINALGQTVYISTGSSAKKYHSTSNCRGLSNSKYIKSISIEEAQGIGRTPCMLCMSNVNINTSDIENETTTIVKYKEQHKTEKEENMHSLICQSESKIVEVEDIPTDRNTSSDSEMLEVRYHNIENQISDNKKQMREFSKSSIEYKVRKEENKALKEQMNKIDEEYFKLTGRYIYNGGEN